MENIDYEYLCTVIGNLSCVPIRLFRGEKQVFYHAVVSLPEDPIKPYLKDILSITSHIGYYVTPDFFYYGIVRSGESTIAIGPSMQVKADDQTLKELAFRCDVVREDIQDFVAGMKAILPLPLDSILQMLCAMNYVMNGEKLDWKICASTKTSRKRSRWRRRNSEPNSSLTRKNHLSTTRLRPSRPS